MLHRTTVSDFHRKCRQHSGYLPNGSPMCGTASLCLCISDIQSLETDSTSGSFAHWHSDQKPAVAQQGLTYICQSGPLTANQNPQQSTALLKGVQTYAGFSPHLQPCKVTEESFAGVLTNCFTVNRYNKGALRQLYTERSVNSLGKLM